MNKPFSSMVVAAAFMVATPAAFAEDLLKRCGFSNYTVGGSEFAGIYDGDFAGTLKHTLAILDTTESGNAAGLYGHGVAKQWGINQANCFGMGGKVEGNKLTFKTPAATVEYVFDGDSVDVTYTSPRGVTKGKLHRRPK